MKYYVTLIALCIAPFVCSQSYGEFKIHDNGLIYSKTAVGKLKKIVDSLNLKFKVCDLSKNFQSLPQAQGYYVELVGPRCKEALADLKSGMSADVFIQKYHPEHSSLLSILQQEYINYEKQPMISWQMLDLLEQKDYEVEILKDEFKTQFSGPLKQKWVYDYKVYEYDKSEHLSAMYFLSSPESKPIPFHYSRAIQYALCMIDTTQTVMLTNRDNYERFDRKHTKAFTKFWNYLEKKYPRVKPRSYDYELVYTLDQLNENETPDTTAAIADDSIEKVDFFTLDSTAVVDTAIVDTTIVDTTAAAIRYVPQKPSRLYRSLQRMTKEERQQLIDENEANYWYNYEQDSIWESHLAEQVQKLFKTDKKFSTLLQKAYDDAISHSSSNADLERVVAWTFGGKEALEMKRRRRVIGGCSMDQGPRIHAQEIAVLAAETTKWEIFLRSHLDIMNDCFDRVSDGSYAYAGRKTYIRELEVLDINLTDLILGITLRIDNASPNHYFSSISRMGRALAESQDREGVERTLLAAVSAPDLDVYNRQLFYYLYLNYVYNLPETTQREIAGMRLNAILSSLPFPAKGYVEKK
ncbi:MAG: hypothetical protein RLZZ500_1302 [Bacteroidota bacterium]|jgi:hypothetical protein